MEQKNKISGNCKECGSISPKFMIFNLESLTKDNNCFRNVVATTNEAQLVIMKLNQGEELKTEVHHDSTQIIIIRKGKGLCILNNVEKRVSKGDCIVIPTGVEHNLIAHETIKLFTFYAGPTHVC